MHRFLGNLTPIHKRVINTLVRVPLPTGSTLNTFIMPRCACAAKAYGSLLVFLSVCHSVILCVTGIAAQRVQFKC